MQSGDMNAARADFEKAVRLNPRSADAQNMLGQVLLQQDDLDEAISHFRTLVGLRPKLAIARAYLAQALQAKGLLDEATLSFALAVDLGAATMAGTSGLGTGTQFAA